MTKQENRRVAGNKKGIFTRDRQPKMAAHVMRSRSESTLCTIISSTKIASQDGRSCHAIQVREYVVYIYFFSKDRQPKTAAHVMRSRSESSLCTFISSPEIASPRLPLMSCDPGQRVHCVHLYLLQRSPAQDGRACHAIQVREYIVYISVFTRDRQPKMAAHVMRSRSESSVRTYIFTRDRQPKMATHVMRSSSESTLCTLYLHLRVYAQTIFIKKTWGFLLLPWFFSSLVFSLTAE
jgi:hypothetical protein